MLEVEKPLRGKIAELVAVRHDIVRRPALGDAVWDASGIHHQLVVRHDKPLVPARLEQLIVHIVFPDRVEAGAEDGDFAWAVLVAVALDDQGVLGHLGVGVIVGVRIHLAADGEDAALPGDALVEQPGGEEGHIADQSTAALHQLPFGKLGQPDRDPVGLVRLVDEGERNRPDEPGKLPVGLVGGGAAEQDAARHLPLGEQFLQGDKVGADLLVLGAVLEAQASDGVKEGGTAVQIPAVSHAVGQSEFSDHSRFLPSVRFMPSDSSPTRVPESSTIWRLASRGRYLVTTSYMASSRADRSELLSAAVASVYLPLPVFRASKLPAATDTVGVRAKSSATFPMAA